MLGYVWLSAERIARSMSIEHLSRVGMTIDTSGSTSVRSGDEAALAMASFRMFRPRMSLFRM